MKRNRAAVLVFLVLAGSFLFREPRLAAPPPSPKRARNLVLFVGDGMGLSTINTASIYGHQHSRALFIQSLPHLGLSDTSSADSWVTDSAAGMTALMTGSKTLNGVISQGPQGLVRGKKDGPVLKTLLEYAEERGLSTGLVTNDRITGATPAVCYAHVNDRSKETEIAAQLLTPRFGDGVDVLVGVGRESFLPRTAGGERNDGRDLIAEMRTRGYHYAPTPEEFLAVQPNKDGKVLALFPCLYEPEAVVEKAISLLSRNPRGYFLMVEWNSHQNSARETLDNTLRLDRSARRARALTDPRQTLLVVTADHSYDLRLTEAKIGDDVLSHVQIVGGRHTAEEVMVAADGPGAERIRGFLSNTDVFHVMKAALGFPPVR